MSTGVFKGLKKNIGLHCTFPPVDTILYSIAKDRMPNGFTGTAFRKYIPEINNEHTTEPYSKKLKFPVQIWFEMQIFYYQNLMQLMRIWCNLVQLKNVSIVEHLNWHINLI